VIEADGPKHSVSVSAVILDNQGRALAIRRHDNGDWEPPGGVLELSESITAGLIREVEEETGLLVEPERLTGVYKNITRGIIALVFRCHIVGGTPTPSAETPQLAWLSLAVFSERMSEAYAVRIHDSVSETVPSIRLHDGQHVVAPSP
jgi:ADP-ribose pyrophosphatase YjhB (NUDIX family)